MRQLICTTNTIESVTARLRKIVKTRGHFTSDDAATTLIWLARRNITADGGRAANNWKPAMNQFASVRISSLFFMRTDSPRLSREMNYL